MCKSKAKTMDGYTTDKENLHIFRGELALALAVIINSFGVVLMLYSVIFRCGNFGYIECSVCVFGGYSESIARNVDIYFSRIACFEFNDT